MPRKPIEIETRGLLTPRERVWNAVRKLRKGFTVWSVQDHCEPMVEFGICRDYLRDLEASAFIARGKDSVPVQGKGIKRTAPEFNLVKDQFDAPRLRRGKVVTSGAGMQAMWTAMKVHKRFTSDQLARAASFEGMEVKLKTAMNYIGALTRSGHLRVITQPAKDKPGVYALVKNTGAHAPAITALKCVFDRNTGELLPMQTVQEVCDGIE
jgi:hypothetical protein